MVAHGDYEPEGCMVFVEIVALLLLSGAIIGILVTLLIWASGGFDASTNSI